MALRAVWRGRTGSAAWTAGPNERRAASPAKGGRDSAATTPPGNGVSR
jgi:hypothetical protein